jgi:3-oxoacyl-[acyl-carrier protein] reductase
MDLNLNGKHALVCGSTQGIGKAAAIELALLGATVTLLARDAGKLQSVLSELSVTTGQHHDFLAADFSNPSALRQTLEAYPKRDEITILLNNTGGPPPGQAIDARSEDFVNAFTNHLLCNQVLVQSVVDGMKKLKYGRIINVISTSVKIPIRGLGVSNTIRGAVANWAKTLSVELGGFGITVNNVLPGATMTGRLESIIQRSADKNKMTFEESKLEMIKEIPAGRIAAASEVGAAIAFLASPAASYINGINLPVDGGRTGCL